MALKAITLKDKRNRMYSSVLNTLKGFMPVYAQTWSGYIKENTKIGYFWSNDLDECIEQFYGSTDDKENDIEWKLAKVLFMFSITKKLSMYAGRYDDEITSQNKQNRNLILANTKAMISDTFNEYKIFWETNDDFVKFESLESKVIIENIEKLPVEIADPIKGLVSPLKTDTELRGLIAEVYGAIEKIKKDKKRMQEVRDNLNESENGMLNDVIKLSGRLVNDLEANGKAHIGSIRLKLKDAAHNYALLSSLFYKTIEISNNQRQKEIK